MGAFQSLKSFALFEGLTTTESSVFDRELTEAKCAARSAVDIGGSLLVITQGKLTVAVETANEPIQFTSVGKGELVGELAFFEPSPVRLHVTAETDTEYVSIDRRALKHCFRYSRTGAVKVMIGFARSLSHRIRSANDVLQKRVESDPSFGETFHRPSQLDKNDVQHVVNLAASRGFDAGEVIFQEGDMGRELYVIREGEVEIARSGASGAPMTLARLGAGDYFGEMAFVDEKPRSASATALSPLQVCVLPSGTLDRAVELNVGMALYLTGVVCKIMARRLNATLKKLAS